MVVQGQSSADGLTGKAHSVWFVLVRPDAAKVEPDEALKDKQYCGTRCTLAHQPIGKIRFEYAKSLFHSRDFDPAERFLRTMIRTVNCDWRRIYTSYHVLSLIVQKDLGAGNSKARNLNAKTLNAHPNFITPRVLREQLQ